MRQQDDKEAENMSYYGTTINDSAVIVVKAGEEIPAPAFLAVGADGKVATAGKNAIGIVMPGCDDKVTVGDDLDVQIKDIGAWTGWRSRSIRRRAGSRSRRQGSKATAKSFIVGIALEAATKCRSAYCCTDRKSRLQAAE